MQRAKRGRLEAKIWLEFLCNLLQELCQLFFERDGIDLSPREIRTSRTSRWKGNFRTAIKSAGLLQSKVSILFRMRVIVNLANIGSHRCYTQGITNRKLAT